MLVDRESRALSPHPRRLVVALAALALLAAAAACGPGRALSPEEIQDHGTLLLRTSPAKAYRAVQEALKGLGYEIDEETPDKGIIVTKRRPVPDMSIASTSGGVFSRRYTIEVRDLGGVARVIATPQIFENDRDVSKKKIWDLEGGLGEHELWKQLFAKIEQLL